MKIKAMFAVLFLAVSAGSSIAHAIDPSQEGACFITTEYGTTCSLATYGACISNNSRENGVIASWTVGPCPGEVQAQKHR
jgi:hypothetical protein